MATLAKRARKPARYTKACWTNIGDVCHTDLVGTRDTKVLLEMGLNPMAMVAFSSHDVVDKRPL